MAGHHGRSDHCCPGNQKESSDPTARSPQPEKDQKPSSGCELSSENIVCTERLTDRQVGRESEHHRIADNGSELRERQSKRTPGNQSRGTMAPRLLLV